MKSIAEKFKIDGKCIYCERYGNGHINETYLVKTDCGKEYILQKINSYIFKDIPNLMNNIIGVTDHLKKKILARGGDPESETLVLVPTLNGEKFLYENGGYYRTYIFIKDSLSLQKAEKPEHFYESARAFGAFQNDLADYPAKELFEVLPRFHDTSKRLNDLLISADNDKFKRLSEVREEFELARSFENESKIIVNALKSGELPYRVTHNDTKLNNVLLNAKTEKYLAVIDLDTVMPGSLLYDFGDSIRFGANNAAEDEKDLDKVYLDISLYKSYEQGFLSVCKNITAKEKELLPISAFLMTFECGIRFLADYLDGDVYFRTAYPEHNLVRARNQLKLAKDIVMKYDTLFC